MSSNNTPNRTNHAPDFFDQARNELFSHILRCGVLKAAAEDQKEWFDDTMEYLADRYEYLTDEELDNLRQLGEQYCRPVIKHTDDARKDAESETVGAAN